MVFTLQKMSKEAIFLDCWVLFFQAENQPSQANSMSALKVCINRCRNRHSVVTDEQQMSA